MLVLLYDKNECGWRTADEIKQIVKKLSKAISMIPFDLLLNEKKIKKLFATAFDIIFHCEFLNWKKKWVNEKRRNNAKSNGLIYLLLSTVW